MASKNTNIVEQPTKRELETKAQIRESLAKIMAIENISVRHENVPTASFDVVNRNLILPVFSENMSDDLYTMLITHEVGHALYTPSSGWTKIMNDPRMRHIVNVVEDCRIEKMMIRKFPGTRSSFAKATQEMLDADIFGLDSGTQKMEDYGLVDRLNLHFKPGRYVGMDVPLSTKELYWADEIDDCETFEDVLKVSKRLHSYIENETDEQENEDDQDQQQGSGNSKQVGSPNNQPSTQDAMDGHVKRYVDQNVYAVEHLNIPSKIILDKIVVPYKTVHSQIRKKWYVDKQVDPTNPNAGKNSGYNYYSRYNHAQVGEIELAEETYSKFLSKNKKIINNLVNMFQQRKSAKLHSKTKISPTGSLDTNKLHTYKYNDDVFKKMRTVPKGKNHGMVMFLDLSGSMQSNMYGSIEQIMNLVMFCKKLSLPFEVYGFTDNTNYRSTKKTNKKDGEEITYSEGDIDLSDRSFQLRQYFTNKMKASEFKEACINMFAIANGHISKSIGKDSAGNTTYCTLPPEEQLGGTPLDPAIIASIQVVNDMKKKYSLDIINAIFVTDGESSHWLSKRSGNNGHSTQANLGGDVYVTHDRKANKSWRLNMKRTSSSYNNITNHWLSIMKQVTGANTVGFYLANSSSVSYYLDGRHLNGKRLTRAAAESLIKSNGFIESKEHGYDAYYYVEDGEQLKTSDDPDIADLLEKISDSGEAEEQINKNMQAAVSNEMKNKRKKRVLLSRFIDIIA